jgi:mannan endo-1,4-beta-mannosidase
MKVVRMWAHSITPGWEMQTGPATYDEKVLKGMDFVMDECHKRGLKVCARLAAAHCHGWRCRRLRRR